MSKKEKHCHYSGLPSPMAYETKKDKKMNVKKQILKWYPIGIAFTCLLYSVGLGLAGNTAEAIYSAHWQFIRHIGLVQYYYLV